MVKIGDGLLLLHSHYSSCDAAETGSFVFEVTRLWLRILTPPWKCNKMVWVIDYPDQVFPFGAQSFQSCPMDPVDDSYPIEIHQTLPVSTGSYLRTI